MCKTSNSGFKVGLADGANPLSVCIVPPLAQGLVLRATVSLKGFAGAPGRSGAIRFRWALHAYKGASTFINVRGGLLVRRRSNKENAFDKLIPFIMIIKKH
jgi:hypothetical protein